MADIKFAEVYACSEHFFVKNNTSLLAPYPVPTLSRNFVRYTDIRDFQQKNNGSSAAETGELYIIFDNLFYFGLPGKYVFCIKVLE